MSIRIWGLGHHVNKDFGNSLFAGAFKHIVFYYEKWRIRGKITICDIVFGSGASSQ